jgi:DNA-binding LytR/AlgR family response regulator
MLKDLNKSGGHLIYRDGPVKKMLPFKDIKYLESEGNYSTVFMDNKKFTYKLSLTKMLKDLDPEIFFQIHKKCIVNKNYIISIDFKKNIVDIGNTQYTLGRVYRAQAQKYFKH